MTTWPHCVNTTWSSAGFTRNLVKYNELLTHVLQDNLIGSIIPVSMCNPGVCGTIGLYQITATVFTMVRLYSRHQNGTRIFTMANAFRNCWHNINILGHLSGPPKAEPGGRTTFRSLCEIGSNLMICFLALSPMYWDHPEALLRIRWNIENSQVHFSAETWAVTTVSDMATINDMLSLKKDGASDMKRRRFLCQKPKHSFEQTIQCTVIWDA